MRRPKGKRYAHGPGVGARRWVRPSLVAAVMALALSCGQSPVIDDESVGEGTSSIGEGILTTAGSGRAAVPIQSVSGRPPLPFVGGRVLETDTATFSLKGTVKGGLMGWLAPQAVPSPDGTVFAYNSWEDLVDVDPEESFSAQGIVDGQPLARPSIRIVDLTTGEDTLLRTGAFSLAWRQDGAIAYFEGTIPEYQVNYPYNGQILVQETLTDQPVQWTAEPARYIVFAWGGDRLIAYREHIGESLDILALDGPGQVRVLAEGANIVALSPDGNRVLVSDEIGPGVRLLDVATGNEVGRIDVSTAAPGSSSVEWLAYGGSWVGEWIAAESNAGIAVLRATGDDLTVDRVLQLGPRPFVMGVHEPQLVGPDGDRVVMWAPLNQGFKRTTAFLDCNLQSKTCTEGPRRDRGAYSQAYNPSRPR